MSLVVVCDKCGRKIEDEQNRVILVATRYTLADQQDQAAAAPVVPASAPPGTPTPPASGVVSVPMNVTGSSQQFLTEPAFGGQLEMHEECWEQWIAPQDEEPAASIGRDEALAQQAKDREEDQEEES
jgi:hypothetical protein